MSAAYDLLDGYVARLSAFCQLGTAIRHQSESQLPPLSLIFSENVPTSLDLGTAREWEITYRATLNKAAQIVRQCRAHGPEITVNELARIERLINNIEVGLCWILRVPTQLTRQPSSEG